MATFDKTLNPPTQMSQIQHWLNSNIDFTPGLAFAIRNVKIQMKESIDKLGPPAAAMFQQIQSTFHPDCSDQELPREHPLRRKQSATRGREYPTARNFRNRGRG